MEENKDRQIDTLVNRLEVLVSELMDTVKKMEIAISDRDEDDES